jgi:hypothetical protein
LNLCASASASASRGEVQEFCVSGQGGAWEHVQGLGWRKKKGESIEKKYAAFDPFEAPSLLSVFLGYNAGI